MQIKLLKRCLLPFLIFFAIALLTSIKSFNLNRAIQGRRTLHSSNEKGKLDSDDMHKSGSEIKESNAEDLSKSEEISRDGLSIADEILHRNFSLKFSPPMTVEKFETMQSRRVIIEIKYADLEGYRLYSDVTERIIKSKFPDILVQKTPIPVESSKTEGIFEILVDNKVISSKRWERPSVFLQMGVIRDAIRKRRIERRKGKYVYGEPSTYKFKETVKHASESVNNPTKTLENLAEKNEPHGDVNESNGGVNEFHGGVNEGSTTEIKNDPLEIKETSKEKTSSEGKTKE